MIKRFSLTFLLLFLCVPAFAKAPLQKVTIILDWFVNPQQAPIIIAQEAGFFKRYGLNVNIIAPADPADPPKLVAANKADIAIGYQPEMYMQIQQGLPLVRIGTLIDTPLRVMAVLQSSNIHSLNDMAGKSVGYSLAGVGTAILKTMLQYHNVDPSKVKFINVHYNQVQALLSHRVDAISGVGRNFEIPELKLAGHPARAFYPEDNGVPNFDALILLANRNALKQKKLLQFMLALKAATQYLQEHPQKSWQLMLRHHPELNNKLNQMAWQITLPLFANNPLAFSQSKYQNMAEWMLKHKLINKILPMRYYAVNLQTVQHNARNKT